MDYRPPLSQCRKCLLQAMERMRQMKSTGANFSVNPNNVHVSSSALINHFSPFYERWHSIQNFEESYEVSVFGRIKSLPRFARYKNGVRSVPGRILRQTVRNHGYLTVMLSSGKGHQNFTVHSLVAGAFLGPRPFGLVVHHIDSNKLNNYVSNLAYISFHENLEHRIFSRGEDHYSAKLRNGDIPRIRLLASQGRKVSQIAEMFGVSSATVSDVLARRTWIHIRLNYFLGR
jgi:NUMOD4 motif/HNH endonuclease